MLRIDFIRRKLQLIAEDLQRLASFGDVSLEELSEDYIRLAAVERLLERTVTRAIDVNQHIVSELSTGKERRATRFTYRETFTMLSDFDVYPSEFGERIAESAGLRNLLIHDYNDVDHEIVHGSIRSCLRDYEQYIRYLDAFIEGQPPPL